MDGEGHRCAEDAGGPTEWKDVRNAYKKKSGDKDLREWYEKTCNNFICRSEKIESMAMGSS